MSNHSGVGTALSAAEVQAQRVEDERAAAADSAAMQRDKEAAEGLRLRAQHVWLHAVHRHVEQLMVLFKDPHFPDDPEQQKTLSQLQADLADAVELLWPAA